MTIELKGLVPFDGDGHWHLCLDYRKSKDHPQVTYIDTETPLIAILQDLQQVLDTKWTETGIIL